MAQVDAEQRRRAAARDLRGTKDGAVAAEHHHQLEVAEGDIAAEHGDRPELGGRRHEVVELVLGQHRRQPEVDQALADLDARRQRVGAPGVRDHEDVPLGCHGT